MSRAVPLRFVLLAGSLGLLAAALPAADERLQPISDDPNLPRVLLVGDSISMGYTLPVRAALAGRANVHRIPANAGTSRNVREHVDEWLGEKHWDVIHINVGLHDLKRRDGQRQVSPEDYEANLRAIVQRLKQSGATVIWATTTPVPEGAANRTPGDEVLYNDVAARVVRDEAVAVNDLFALARGHQSKWQRRADVHFNAAGYRGLAKAVASAIAERLPAADSAASDK